MGTGEGQEGKVRRRYRKREREGGREKGRGREIFQPTAKYFEVHAELAAAAFVSPQSS